MSENENVLQEHFWFTATVSAANAFLMSTTIDKAYWPVVTSLSTVISIYAVFLIVHRSAAAAEKLRFPDDLTQLPESQRTFIHKARETWHHLRIIPSHLLFVICEFSGAFFYILLIVFSCVGVWLTH